MTIYHYYATKHISPNQIVHLDGIAILQKPIQSREDYTELKKLLVKDLDMGDHLNLTICGLAVLQA